MINQVLDLSHNSKINVLTFDYSGYGESTGKPSEQNLVCDLEAIYKYALHIGYKPNNIILYG